MTGKPESKRQTKRVQEKKAKREAREREIREDTNNEIVGL